MGKCALSRLGCFTLAGLLSFSVAAASSPEEKMGRFTSKTTGDELEFVLHCPKKLRAPRELVVYPRNGKWAKPELSAFEKVVSDLNGKGLFVCSIDYKGNPKATAENMAKGDAVEFVGKDFINAVQSLIGHKVDRFYVVPEGYLFRNDVHIYTSPDNGKKYFGAIAYPANPKEPVPLLVRMDYARDFEPEYMAGAEFLGFGMAWGGHPYFYYKAGIFKKGKDFFAKTIDWGRTVVRVFRARAKEFNVDPERIGVWGSSKHGNISVWLGVLSNMKDYPTFCDLFKDVSPSVQAVFASATVGMASHFKEDGVPPEFAGEYIGLDSQADEVMMKQIDWATYLDSEDPPMALDCCHGGYWRTMQVKRLILVVHEKKIKMIQSMDKNLPNYRPKNTWVDFAIEVLAVKGSNDGEK